MLGIVEVSTLLKSNSFFSYFHSMSPIRSSAESPKLEHRPSKQPSLIKVPVLTVTREDHRTGRMSTESVVSLACGEDQEDSEESVFISYVPVAAGCYDTLLGGRLRQATDS